MNSVFAIFISVFFIFGIYSAAAELYCLSRRIYKKFKSRRIIDKRDNSR